ncbi:MAG TPA: YjjG family noncanonical pyrimidine nucleotidase [Bacteroidales bacterium]|nr:YjjG family noncanonical pyrimidine nucleotidase [Bacteroidales bacterium]
MQRKNYTHIFFDLDHTLWDFDANNRITFDEILKKHDLYNSGIKNIDNFLEIYDPYNKMLWDLYKKGSIEKNYLSYRRFELTLLHLGIDNTELAKAMAADYIQISPTKTRLKEGAIEVLEYLQSHYILGLLTNGFNEIQYLKIRNSGLEKYFPFVVTSEEAGSKKPDTGIFEFILNKTNTNRNECIYIGDEPETDIVGAAAAGIDSVLVTFGKYFGETPATFTIKTLYQLKEIL